MHSAINIAARRRSLKKKNKKIQTYSSLFFGQPHHSTIPERFLFVETFAFSLFYLCAEFVVGIEAREIVGAFCRRVFELLLTRTESRVPSPKRRRKSQDLVNSRLATVIGKYRRTPNQRTPRTIYYLVRVDRSSLEAIILLCTGY